MIKQDIYLAPLEGITGMVFRNALFEVFGDHPDKYFAPFIVPHSKKGMTSREKRELSLENNRGIKLVPQILSKSSKDFINTQIKIKELGHDEVNLNLGCPSGTVVAKGKGAGFLKNIKELDDFLYDIFDASITRISVKTRIGYENTDEFLDLLDVFNKYGFTELIIHPRLRSEMYEGNIHMETYAYAEINSRNKLVFNGDITNAGDVDTVMDSLHDKIAAKTDGTGNMIKTKAVMIGRGMLRDPSLIRQIKGGDGASKEELIKFMDHLSNGYRDIQMEDKQVLCKLKEIWAYMSSLVHCDKKRYKSMMKSRDLNSFSDMFCEAVAQSSGLCQKL